MMAAAVAAAVAVAAAAAAAGTEMGASQKENIVWVKVRLLNIFMIIIMICTNCIVFAARTEP